MPPACTRWRLRTAMEAAGEAATPQSMAKALLAIVTLPDDVSADIIEVRAARAGTPPQTKSL